MITLIAACTEDGVIGRAGDMPWHLPGELRFFKAATMGKPLVVGRTTWESIGRPLPGRRMIVVTRQPDYRADGVEVVHSPDEALALVHDEPEIMIGGGATIYEALLPRADRLLLTVIHASIEGDTFFPAVNLGPWRVHSAVPTEQGDGVDHAFTRYDLRRCGDRPTGVVPAPLRRG